MVKINPLFKPEFEFQLRHNLALADARAWKQAEQERKTEAERKQFVAAMKLQSFLEKKHKKL